MTHTPDEREALEHSLDDYMNAPSGFGPLASEWADKPHRLVYDLVAALRQPTAPAAEFTREQVIAFAMWLLKSNEPDWDTVAKCIPNDFDAFLASLAKGGV